MKAEEYYNKSRKAYEESRRAHFSKLFKEITQTSDELFSASDAAINLVRDIKEGYENLSGTFDISQTELSNKIRVSKKMEEMEDNLKQIMNTISILDNKIDKITNQTRPSTLWEKLKNSILENILQIFLGMLIGILFMAIGLGFLLTFF